MMIEFALLEVTHRDCRNGVGRVAIFVYIRDVGNICNIGDVSNVVEPDVASPPRGNRLEWCERQPSKVAESDADIETAAEAEERDVCRAIDWNDISWFRVPGPAVRGRVEPPAIVIRRPSPRLIADPCVAPERFPHPGAIVVRSPVLGLIVRNPDVAVLIVVAPST